MIFCLLLVKTINADGFSVHARGKDASCRTSDFEQTNQRILLLFYLQPETPLKRCHIEHFPHDSFSVSVLAVPVAIILTTTGLPEVS
jgi:hypothetical protein